MKKCTAVLFGLVVLGVVGCGKHTPSAPVSDANAPAEEAAIESARAWLDLVDSGSYAESWEEAATAFKSAVSQGDWEKTARAVRLPLGKVLSRRIKGQQYATSLPGAPAGEYVVIQYDATFENRANLVETVTPMLDPDGTWKVSGYFVK